MTRIYRNRVTASHWREFGRSMAEGRRRPGVRLLRLLRFRVIQVLLRVHRRVVPQFPVASVLQYEPAPTTAAEHADLRARASWYLKGLEISISLTGPPIKAVDAPWMHPDYTVVPAPEGRDMSDRSRHQLLHDVSIGEVYRALRSRSSITVVDPMIFNAADCGGYAKLQHTYGGRSKVAAGVHPRLRELLKDQQLRDRTALVLATGPSARELDLSEVTHHIRITCNSAVRDVDLLERFRPNIITFADPVFHFGPNRYAAEFRADVVRAVELTDALLLIPESYASLMAEHYPNLVDHLVPFSTSRHKWSFPSLQDDQLQFRGTDNILTLAMLPVAFGLASQVDIAGSDGRASGERYFWRHNPQLQYSDELMESVFAAHPSFFRDRHYRTYYRQHCHLLESLLSFGEEHGVSVRAATSSHIPALRRRGAPEPVPVSF